LIDPLWYLASFCVGHSVLTMPEYFRDDARQDVSLLIDNIFRFIQARSEASGFIHGQLPFLRFGCEPRRQYQHRPDRDSVDRNSTRSSSRNTSETTLPHRYRSFGNVRATASARQLQLAFRLSF